MKTRESKSFLFLPVSVYVYLHINLCINVLICSWRLQYLWPRLSTCISHHRIFDTDHSMPGSVELTARMHTQTYTQNLRLESFGFDVILLNFLHIINREKIILSKFICLNLNRIYSLKKGGVKHILKLFYHYFSQKSIYLFHEKDFVCS